MPSGICHLSKSKKKTKPRSRYHCDMQNKTQELLNFKPKEAPPIKPSTTYIHTKGGAWLFQHDQNDSYSLAQSAGHRLQYRLVVHTVPSKSIH